MTQPIYLVDAFAERPFAGNPAGVCPLQAEASPEWMQSVASEMHQAETAFVRPIADGFELRWFTPTTEVSLCGHATLAASHILWTTGLLAEGEVARFQTASGPLSSARVGDRIEMDFPAEIAFSLSLPEGLVSALGLDTRPLATGKNRMDYLVEIADEEELRELRPNFSALQQVPVRGVMVTARSKDPEYDFVSRFFAPASGVDEDAVTGSAHCCLGPYWSDKLSKTVLRGYQASARGGVVEVEVRGDRVVLRGTAVTVLEGTLRC